MLSAEGLVETGFTSPTTFNGFIDNAFEYLGERLYLFGNFSSYRGTTANNVIRIDFSGNIA
jgi:hypothetical protein